jgi:hypothetical protein
MFSPSSALPATKNPINGSLQAAVATTTMRAFCTLPLVSYGRRPAFKQLALVDPSGIPISLLSVMGS